MNFSFGEFNKKVRPAVTPPNMRVQLTPLRRPFNKHSWLPSVWRLIGAPFTVGRN